MMCVHNVAPPNQEKTDARDTRKERVMKAPMTIQQRSHSALDFLDEADREFAAGDIRQASEKLWGAATDAVTAVAIERGWRHRSHRDIKNAVLRLADEHDDRLLRAEFAAAEKFHINFYHDTLEDHEFELDSPIVHDFVHHALTLLQNA